MTTSDNGHYHVTSRQPGLYTVGVEPAGFNTFFPTNIHIDINKLLAIDLMFEVGGVNEMVNVTGIGTVRDPNGAVMPGAEVAIISEMRG